MGELTVTGLDDETLARLSSLAEAHGRSVDEEAKHLLKFGVSYGQDNSVVAMLAQARQASASSIRSSSLELIEEGRDELA